MKSLLIIPTLCMALLFAGGCSKERQVGAPSESTAIRLGTSVRGSIDASTRADISQTLQGKQLGLFTYSYTGTNLWSTTPDIYVNEPVTAGTIAGGLYPLPLTTTKYYVLEKDHAFYAYYPYTAGLTGTSKTITNDIFANLDANSAQIDWMWSLKAGVRPSSPFLPLELTLDHMMSMVNFAIKKEANIATVLTLEKIEITTSTSQKFTFDVSAGTVTSQTGGTLAFVHTPPSYTVPTAYGTAMAQTLLLPSSVISNISLTINGEVYSTPEGWSLTTDVRGTFKLIEVNIKETEIVITIGGQDWKPGTDTDLTNGSVTISIGDGGWAYKPGSDTDLRNGNASITVGSQGWKDGGTNDLRP